MTPEEPEHQHPDLSAPWGPLPADPMTQTTDTLIERLEALLAKAVSGTWRAVAEDLRGGRYWSVLAPGIDDYVVDGIHEDNAGEATAALIVEAVNALPTLLSALRSTAKEVEAKDAALDAAAKVLAHHGIAPAVFRQIESALTPADPAAKDQA